MARRIREMVGDTDKPALHVYDKALQTMRPARYGDIVILLRSTLMWAPLMIEEFRQQGIPAGGEQSKGYFQATEVEVMLSLLQIVDNPRQDIPLASVLRSPIVGLDEEELAQIRLGDKRQSFYDAVVSATGGLEIPLTVSDDIMGKMRILIQPQFNYNGRKPGRKWNRGNWSRRYPPRLRIRRTLSA